MIAPNRFTVIPFPPSDPAALRLLAALDEYLDTLYSPGACQRATIQSLEQPDVAFAVVVDTAPLSQSVEPSPAGNAANPVVVACGAVRCSPGSSQAELQRVFVDPVYRQRGSGRLLVRYLEDQALSRGAKEVVLETGDAQKEAVVMYTRLGYERCEPVKKVAGCSDGKAGGSAETFWMRKQFM
ncbi:acyl-CoA N-acyltransferase [Gonapodya prolifera JEL478]|uniref:Acyl-CoA N-acyltransferase n=1 Tax=Gonapodya prolifera (strain JEL478) TaxID=1344416 RepID=A0A139AET0_GONPJ|nr:acyl-CoA N-acyltransferase [Gonapodya prolifera JEL478]|eukprot:KXS15287.1 acyl-CoA N-acyltransferase [Gonapodya prolifera JEL478]